jgi:hypothetical protein
MLPIARVAVAVVCVVLALAIAVFVAGRRFESRVASEVATPLSSSGPAVGLVAARDFAYTFKNIFFL